MRNSAQLLLICAFSISSLLGQARGGGSSTGTGTGVGTNPATTPTIPNRTPTPTAPTTPYPTVSRPMYVSGRVMMDDGATPPAGQVTIIRICNGVTRAMGYTDAKGNFSFDLNHADTAFQDASTPGLGNMGGDPTSTRPSLDDPMSTMRNTGSTTGMGSNSLSLMGCELRAQLAGYRSSAVQLAQRRSLDDPDVGVIFLHRLGEGEGSTVSMTSLRAPKDARKAFEKATEALRKKKTEEAEKDLQKAVAAYPQYAEAWFRLGALQMDQKNVEGARNSFSQAIAADPKLVTPYVDLAILNAREGKWKETAENSGKAIRLDPVDFPVAFYFDAVANYNLQNFEAAEKSARQLQKLDTQHHFPMADRILASVLADRKDYSGAAEQMRNYLKFAGEAKDAAEARGQLEQLEKMINEQKEQ